MSEQPKARRCYVITGGTYVHVAPHFSLCAPAFGQVGEDVARELKRLFKTPRQRALDESNASLDSGSRLDESAEQVAVRVLRTTMAGGKSEQTTEIKELYRAAGIKFLETNDDLKKLLAHLVTLPETKIIVLAAAVCDWEPFVLSDSPKEFDEAAKFYEDFVIDVSGSPEPQGGTFGVHAMQLENAYPEFELGKGMPRLQTSTGNKLLGLRPADKLVKLVRSTRKDIFLVGFKATAGESEQAQYISGLGLLKGASCNLVFANDVREHRNMVITPEEAKYHVTKDRGEAIRGLCEMIVARSSLTFTRSTVVEGESVPWDSPLIPESLRAVVNHLIARGAYKPFQGKTVGHFAARSPQDGVIYTSRRKSNFNHLSDDGLLQVEAVGPDEVVAYGGKPSVGGQSQRIIFSEHPDVDCIVHAHVPLREGAYYGLSYAMPRPPVRSQREFECGSHECGRNTSEGLRDMVNPPGSMWRCTPIIKAVHLDEHGPNICFSRTADPREVIAFIETFWDLELKTGGPVELT